MPMRNQSEHEETFDAEAFNTGLRHRLNALFRDVSQSEMARRTGYPQSSINRYAKDRKIPAEFCAALIKALGLNPAWLMTGEGQPYTAEVAETTSGVAMDMLELSKALRSITEMKLGSLAGRDHTKALQSLNASLESYRKQHDKLSERTQSMLADILDRIEPALKQEKMVLAKELIDGAAYLVNFTTGSNELKRRFYTLSARWEFNYGAPNRALEYQKKVFDHYFLNLTFNDEDKLLEHGTALFIQLYFANRFVDARKIIRSMLAMVTDLNHYDANYAQGFVMNAVADAQLGHIGSATEQISRAISELTTQQLRHAAIGVCLPLLYSCTVNLQAIQHIIPAAIGRSNASARYALIRENIEDLLFVEQHCLQPAEEGIPPTRIRSQQVRCVLRALRDKDKSTIKQFEDFLKGDYYKSRDLDGLRDYPAISRCQINRILGNTERARELLLEAEAVIDAHAPKVLPPLYLRFIHAHNALRIVDRKSKSKELSAIRERSADFLKDYYTRGYKVIEPLLEHI